VWCPPRACCFLLLLTSFFIPARLECLYSGCVHTALYTRAYCFFCCRLHSHCKRYEYLHQRCVHAALYTRAKTAQLTADNATLETRLGPLRAAKGAEVSAADLAKMEKEFVDLVVGLQCGDTTCFTTFIVCSQRRCSCC
jgi:hypothetical protein